jgi:hypothetical protein
MWYFPIAINKKANKDTFSKFEAEVRLKNKDAIVSDIKMP